MEKLESKIIQIVLDEDDHVHALCEDGSAWWKARGEWNQIHPPHSGHERPNDGEYYYIREKNSICIYRCTARSKEEAALDYLNYSNLEVITKNE